MSENKPEGKSILGVGDGSGQHFVEGRSDTIFILREKLFRLEKLEELAYLTYVDTNHSEKRVMYRIKRCAELRQQLGLIEPHTPEDPEVEEM